MTDSESLLTNQKSVSELVTNQRPHVALSLRGHRAHVMSAEGQLIRGKGRKPGG